MSRRPQEESIYTLQRRIGTQRQRERPHAESGPTNAQSERDASTQPHRKRFTLGALFSLRTRTA